MNCSEYTCATRTKAYSRKPVRSGVLQSPIKVNLNGEKEQIKLMEERTNEKKWTCRY